MKIGGQGSFSFPIHCVQCGEYFIVSDSGEHCIKVFNREGHFQYKFGKKGRGTSSLIIHVLCQWLSQSTR